MEFAYGIGIILLYLLMAALCLAAVILSCLSVSGTWLVVLAAVVSYFLPEGQFAGWVSVSVFLLLAASVEALEFAAGFFGVTGKGGSRLAGLMALTGGIAGAILGSLIPVPLLGSLIGMFLLSFILVYAVEYKRLKKHEQAADIAAGSVIARAAVILLKVTITMAMILYLWGAMLIRALS